MANTDKNIIITPNIGSSSDDPKIEFKGASSVVGPSTITAKVYPNNNGTLSFEGSAGQLFSITNNLTSGSIFSVNDVSGIPSIDVNANGTILLGHYGGNIGVGTTNPSYKLDVNGDINFTGTFRQNGSQFIASRWTSGTGDNIYRLNGNVGVGITNPSYKLHVIGGDFSAPYARISGGAEINQQLYLNLNGNEYAEVIAIRGGNGSSGGAYIKWQSPFGDTAFVGHKQPILGGAGYDYTILSTSGLGFGVATNNRTNYDFYIDTSGNTLIGIGAIATGTASQKLQVTGGAYVSGNLGIGITNPGNDKLRMYGGNITDVTLIANTEPRINLNTTDGLRNATLFNSYGNVGLVGYGGGSNYILYHYNQGVKADQYTYFQTGGLERLRINGGGCVLIGTATSTGTASQLLQVNSGAYVSGNLGVGVVNPTSKLDVNGAISATSLTTSNDITLSGELNFTTASAKYIDFYTDNDAGGLFTANLRLVNNGNSSFHNGIVMTRGGAVTLYHNNAAKLATTSTGVDITGTLTASGNISSNSDIKLKTNIKTLTNSLDKVLSMRGVEFDRIDLDGKHQVGVIAQEVESIVPELVSKNNGIKSVAYGNITALLIEAIKEQQEQINILNQKLNQFIKD